jgi:CheY-like chemotaxis protein
MPTVGTSDGPAWTAVVVASDEDVRALLRSLLVLEGVTIVADVAGAAEATERVHQDRPSLLIIERGLSDGDAQTLADTAKAAHPDVWTVVVSSDEVADEHPILTGPTVDGVVRRPFHRSDFVRTLPPRLRGDR